MREAAGSHDSADGLDRQVGPQPKEIRRGSSEPIRALRSSQSVRPTKSSRSTWSSRSGKKSFGEHCLQFWRSYVVPWWPSLVGLLAMANAFTLQSWVAILQFASGVVLLHQRAVERLTLIFRGQMWARILYIELGASAANSLLALAVCVARSSVSLNMQYVDVLYVLVAIGGSCCSWSRWWAWVTQDGYLAVRTYGSLPALPLVFLSTVILATASALPVAMLPFLGIFLTLLARMQTVGLAPVNIPTRLVLVAWTSIYIISFFILHFTGSWAPEVMVQGFGVLAERATDECTAAVSWMRCRSHIWDFGLHLSVVLVLQFMLVNKRGSKTQDGARDLQYWANMLVFEVDNTAADFRTFQAWLLSLLRALECIVLITLALRMPGLHTFPLILKACKDSFSGVCLRCRSWDRRYGSELDPGGQTSQHEQGMCSRGFASSVLDTLLLSYVSLLFVVDSVLRMDALQIWGAWSTEFSGVDDVVEWALRRIDLARVLQYLHPLKYEGGRTAVEVFTLAAMSFVHMMRRQTYQLEAGEGSFLLDLMRWVITRLSRLCRSIMSSSVPLITLLLLFRNILAWESGRASCWTALFSVNFAVLLRVPPSVEEPPSWPWLAMHVLSCFGLVAANAVNAFDGVSPEWLSVYFPAPLRMSSRMSFFAPWPMLCVHLLAWFQHSSTRHQMSRSTPAGQKLVTWASILVAALAMVCRLLRLPVSWTPDELLQKLRRMREELDFFIVVVLAFVTALLPPVDLHSLCLLLSVGAAFLVYNRKVNREKTLPQILRLMHGMSVLFFCLRVVCSTQLVQPPEKGWGLLKANELGVGPIQDEHKILMFVVVSLCARKALVVMRTNQDRTSTGSVDSAVDGTESEYPLPRSQRSALWEEQLLIVYAPSWAPKHAYEIVSLILIVVAYVVSITEVHLLNFIVIVTIIILTGFTHYWVQAGTAFAVTTVGTMTLQYVVRFDVFRQSWVDPELFRRVGVHWTHAEVIRHCSILCLCLVQKQLWFRASLRNKHRSPKCPKWLRSWASIIGVTTLLMVAVARRHIWSVPLVLVTVPWVLRTDHPRTGKGRPEMALYIFRGALIVTLLAQVFARLGAEFNKNGMAHPIFNALCSTWGEAGREECLQDWRRYASFERTEDACFCWLWEFIGLLVLGLVRHLLHCDTESRMSYKRKQKGEARPQDADPDEDQWALEFYMHQGSRHWWPAFVMAILFTIALQGGTILGLVNLLIFLKNGSNTQARLHVRIRWAQITKIVSLFFLCLGLLFQSPLLMCGRTLCETSGGRVFVDHEECVRLESLPLHIYATEDNTQLCGQSDTAMGYDTTASLFVQTIGMRRVSGQGFTAGLLVLVNPMSQLGMLAALVVASVTQLYIYRSPAYLKRGQDRFNAESSDVWLQRAHRYVVDFHCRCHWEALAIKARRQMLTGKLHGTIEKIGHILAGKANTKTKAQMAQKALIEEATLSQGFAKSTARMVLTEDDMFGQVPEVGNAYLEFLRHVTVGRENTHSLKEMETSMRLFEKRQDFLDKIYEKQRERAGVRKMKKRFRLRDITAWPLRKRLVKGWHQFKRSNTLTELMFDYPFLGVDESLWQLKSNEEVQTESLSKHREDNGPVRIIWKILLACMPGLLSVAAACCFLESRSVLDLVRLLFVVFYVVRPFPFVTRLKLQFILVYSVGVVIVRTVYDFPFICPGASFRETFELNGRIRYAWCEVRTPVAGFDVIFGVAKRRGSGAIDPTSWMGAVGLEYVCIAAIYLHRWMLIRSGIWDFVEHDPATQRVWLTAEAHDRLQNEQKPRSITPAEFEFRPGRSECRVSRHASTAPNLGTILGDLAPQDLADQVELEGDKKSTYHRGYGLGGRALTSLQGTDSSRHHTIGEVTERESRERRLARFVVWHGLLVRNHVGLRRKFIDLYEMRAAERFREKREERKSRLLRDSSSTEIELDRLPTSVCHLGSMDSTGNHHELLVRTETKRTSSMEWADRSQSGILQGTMKELRDWLQNLHKMFEELQNQIAGNGDIMQGMSLPRIREKRSQAPQEENMDLICQLGATFSHVRSIPSSATNHAVDHQFSDKSPWRGAAYLQEATSPRSCRSTRRQPRLSDTSDEEGNPSRAESPHSDSEEAAFRTGDSDGYELRLKSGLLANVSVDGKNGTAHTRSPGAPEIPVSDEHVVTNVRAHIAAKKIQIAYLQWVQVRCDMGHRLKWSVAPSSSRATMYDFFGHGCSGPFSCEVCDKAIGEAQDHWWCNVCRSYHACEVCITRLKDEERMKTSARRRRERQRVQDATRPGARLYGFQFAIGFILLIYTLLFNHQLVEGDVSFTESFMNNSFTIVTIVLLVIHLLFLIVDRVFIRVHYYGRGNRSFNRWLLRAQTLIYAAAFIVVHTAAIKRVNVYEPSVRLWNDRFFCIYYILIMCYIAVAILQRKLGLPAVDQDGLRTTRQPEVQGIYSEWVRNAVFLVFYNIPFLDDIRIIIDWAVMPTSLDLWMYFKVEDAHTWLFRTRHLMFMRRQSYFAEARGFLEKLTFGWLFLSLLFFLVIMPIIVFSPITAQFTEAATISHAEATFSLMVSTHCPDAGIDLFQSVADCKQMHVPFYKSSVPKHSIYKLSFDKNSPLEFEPITRFGLSSHEKWRIEVPPLSQEFMFVSPEAGQVLGDMLRGPSPRAAVFVFELLMTFSDGQRVQVPTSACFCAPVEACSSWEGLWPPGVEGLCSGSNPINGEEALMELSGWWDLGTTLADARSGEKKTSTHKVDIWPHGVILEHGSTGHSLRPDLFPDTDNISLTVVGPTGCVNRSFWQCPESTGLLANETNGKLFLDCLLPRGRSSFLASSFSVSVLYFSVVLVLGRYLRNTFQDSSKRAIYEEIPDSSFLLDLVVAINLARDHRELQTEMKLYYCLMKVLRSTHLLLVYGGMDPQGFGIGRKDQPSEEVKEVMISDDAQATFRALFWQPHEGRHEEGSPRRHLLQSSSTTPSPRFPPPQLAVQAGEMDNGEASYRVATPRGSAGWAAQSVAVTGAATCSAPVGLHSPGRGGSEESVLDARGYGSLTDSDPNAPRQLVVL